jgi:ATP-dependent Clp protease ATP-binding subunit ClpX
MPLSSQANSTDPSGSSIKHILITEAVAQRKQAPIYLARGHQHKFHSLIATEEENWAIKIREGRCEKNGTNRRAGSFEEYREKSKAAGVM